MQTGAQLIADERERQITEEGFSAVYDRYFTYLELSYAARCYLGHAIGTEHGLSVNTRRPREWPWDAGQWKPSADPIRDLTKAGALIAAEIDRLIQAQQS